MSLGIYKPGQGYWVRVLTATMIGVLFLAAAAWLNGQTRLVAEKLPKSVWVVKLAQAPTGAPAPGSQVLLVGKATGTDPAPEIGRATVQSVHNDELRIHKVEMNAPTADAATAAGVKVGGQVLAAAGTPAGQHAVEPALLQGLVVMIVLIIGAAVAYWATAINQRFVEFLIATDGEMKKVNWSTGRDIRMSTLVVIFASVVLSASLFVVDFGFQWFFKAIGVLVH